MAIPSAAPLMQPLQSQLEKPSTLFQPVIVNGQRSTKADTIWKSTVRLVVHFEKSTVYCTGALVARTLVTTAAHCVRDRNGADAISVDVEFYDGDGQKTKSLNSRNLVVHGLFDYYKAQINYHPTNDVALISIPDGAPVTHQPVSVLPDRTDLVLGAEVIAAGFGLTELKQSGVLYYTKLKVLRWYNSDLAVHDPSQKSSTCFGDSGGPGFIEKNGKLYLWGIDYLIDDRCNGKATAYYSAISGYQSWLDWAALKFVAPSPFASVK